MVVMRFLGSNCSMLSSSWKAPAGSLLPLNLSSRNPLNPPLNGGCLRAFWYLHVQPHSHQLLHARSRATRHMHGSLGGWHLTACKRVAGAVSASSGEDVDIARYASRQKVLT